MFTNKMRLSTIAGQLRTTTDGLDSYYKDIQERFNNLEPKINSFIYEKNRWARLQRTIADRVSSYPTPETRPSLFGVPVGVKDIFHVDGLETKAGSALPPKVLTGQEADVVSKLRDAGALVLGKTVTAEFALDDPGPTRNPHNTDHTPGGSSSGSAAAVAAGLCPLALGTQTTGSVIRPAAFCGVIGMKPSHGRIPIGGVLPVAPSVDHVGFFTQDVAGAHLAAGVFYDEWRTGDEPGDAPTIGVVEGQYLEQATETGGEHFRSHVTQLEDGGFEPCRLNPFEDIDEINRKHRTLVAAEAALSHDEWYPTYHDRYAPATADVVTRGLDVDISELAAARAGRKATREAVHDAMDENDIDVLVSPSAPGPAPKGIETTGDPIMNLPWSYAGLPTVTLPASRTQEGLPIGLQCTARFGFDEWLLSWCRNLRVELY